MKIHHDLSKLPSFERAVVTIGSYDGVHSGHQQILEQLKELARQTGGESIVVSFHPHPRQVLFPDDRSLQLLNTIDEKVTLLEWYGVDHLVVVPFTLAFARQSAERYIRQFLVKHFSPKYIVIGYDHRFGNNRNGDIGLLKRYQAVMDFQVVEIEKQMVDSIAVSSTKIRNALLAGQIERANQLLGHRYTLSGVVEEGQKIGRQLGYPTANLSIGNSHKLIPVEGIYAVVAYHQQRAYNAMLYIGKRPTLPEWKNKTIEVHLLDFDQNIYGEKLQLHFVKKIRDDQHFDSLEALQAQIQRDHLQTLAIFENAEWQPTSLPFRENKTKKNPSVAVVILNYNGRELLRQFLPAVRQTTYPNCTIVVADNGSTDDSVALLQNEFEEVDIIRMDSNLGFAEGYNEALRRLPETDYFVLLNSDVEVTPGWIDPVIDLMEKDKSIGACQPKVLSHRQRDHFEHAGAAGGWMDYLGYPFCRGRIFNVVEKDKGQYNKAEEVFWASGAALFIRSKLFLNIGGFDPSFYAHMEEIDLCWRIKRAGYKVVVEPASTVYHVGGATLDYANPRKVFLNFRNSLAMILKNERRSKTFWLIPARLMLDGLAGALFLLEGKWRHIRAIVDAHWAFFKSAGAIRRRRRNYDDLIQKVSISRTPNQEGLYRKSIVWAFYARGRKTFESLKF